MGCSSLHCYMKSDFIRRGLPRNLLAGAVIAVVSGAAVALSVLGDNQGSLVGVAISASLLPPAVNTVSYLFMSFFEVIFVLCS